MYVLCIYIYTVYIHIHIFIVIYIYNIHYVFTLYTHICAVYNMCDCMYGCSSAYTEGSECMHGYIMKLSSIGVRI